MKRIQSRVRPVLLPVVAAVAALSGLGAIRRMPRATARRRPSPPRPRSTPPTSTCSTATSRAAYRPGYVTLIANYLPLQDAYGGPNYFKLDPNALYEIHVDNNGDAKEDITFQFRFNNTLKGKTLAIGAAPGRRDSADPVRAR